MPHWSVVTPVLIARRGLVLLLLVAVTWSVAATEQGAVQWQAWSAGLLQQAQQEERLVLLDLTAEWCQFCRKMDEVTYRDA